MANDVKALPEMPKPWHVEYDEIEQETVPCYSPEQVRELRAEVERLRWQLDVKNKTVEDAIARADTAEARLERARALLRDCEATAVRRGDKYLCDAIDNDGEPYQSQALAAFLGEGK